MTALVRYEAARAALQAAHDVDEVKDIRDKAQAMTAYAKQAKDSKLLEWASEIKVRAERRAGEMLAEMKVNGSRARQGHQPLSKPSTLEGLGVSEKQSHRWQKVAAIPEETFQKAVAETKESAGMVTTAAVLRAATKPKKAAAAPSSSKKPKTDDAAAKVEAALQAEREAHAETKEKLAELSETARELEDKLAMFETTEPDEQQKLIAGLQKKIVRKDAEIQRQRGQISDLNNKCNALIRQVKHLQKKNG